MCGIAGIVQFNRVLSDENATLRRMCEQLSHRGPDDEGIDFQNGIGLGIRRLAIIDVLGGRQPYFNENRSVRAVFNGEIYNFRELKSQLESQGHRFQTESDGEVIIPLWEEYGNEFVNHLNGMFAIALHDSNQGHFILVRDRIGIKPLFYALTSDTLIFGSEIKAILSTNLVPHELNHDALGQFLSWEYIPGDQTLFHGIKKLEPATYLDVDLNRRLTTIKTWWDIPSSVSVDQPMEQWEEAIEHKLQQSINRRLISEVPLGAFLSGGVDSSLITAGIGKVKTFSIGFEDPSYHELHWAQKVAQHLGCELKTEIIRPTVVELFDHLMHFMEDPIGDFSIFPTYLVSRLAGQHVTVVLSGDGGDELFCGYETYLAQQVSRHWTSTPPFLRQIIKAFVHRLKPQKKKKGMINKAKRFVEGASLPESLAHSRWRLFLNQHQRQQLLTHEAQQLMPTSVEDHIVKLFEKTKVRNEIDQWLYVDLKSYLCDNILVKVDRMSMACSLEARVPFLDHELVEMAFQMPPHYKLFNRKTKYLLKKIAAKKIPHDCVFRQKEGFSIPMKQWLSTEFRPLLEEHLAPQQIKQEGIFQVQKINQLKNEHFSGKANHSHILWMLLVFQDWRKRWKV